MHRFIASPVRRTLAPLLEFGQNIGTYRPSPPLALTKDLFTIQQCTRYIDVIIRSPDSPHLPGRTREPLTTIERKPIPADLLETRSEERRVGKEDRYRRAAR